MHFQEESISRRFKGKVLLKVAITKDGNIGNVIAVSSLSLIIDDDAINLIKNMQPWEKSGKHNGQKINIGFK